MNIIKVLAMAALSIAATSCMVVPPETGSYSTPVSAPVQYPAQQPVIIQQPTQPVIIQQPAQPVVVQPPYDRHKHCHDPISGEYLKVHPDSRKCHEWLRHNQKEREKHHLCIDRKTGHYVHGVPANSAECHRINRPEPPKHPAHPEHPKHPHQGDKRPHQPIQQPVQQPAPVKSPPNNAAPCIDKRTNQPVNGIPANSVKCATINR